MSTREKTSYRVTRKAAQALRGRETAPSVKSVAGSALSQAAPKKSSSAKAAHHAAQLLGDIGASPTAKSLAGSVLTQRSGAAKRAGSKKVVKRPTKKVAKKATKKAARKAPKKVTKKTTKHATRLAASSLLQQVSLRRNSEGSIVRVVLTPYRGGSLHRNQVESVVSAVLAKHKRK